ncbi:uncharacterized protein ASPGLDRAFT_170097 [Aspergillus glaucus CBS 516.65]|uniref:Uncharacterized protein n=1 Tax=Aspergillus glaucus CBS 516.65 TaxID=1160497 RepID=A0A1L9VN39_ASPGL|nr:hypothetical protein ASPGLDRAFT_170097 [Aspergillus glaucus CBS 516.65]OJJ85292.1 hypothetical protein ASPGLDRAFT_170097 [Aspergillus glaucus CBS 516.65]
MLRPREILTHTVPADIHVSDWGLNWYWAVTAIFTVATLAFLIAGILTQRKSTRTLYYLSALSSYAGCLAYFAMGADLGWVAVQVEFPQGAETRVGTPTRQVYWVRYILWTVSAPLAMIELCLLTGASFRLILLEAVISFSAIVTTLISALIPSSYKWAYFGYGALPWAGITYLAIVTGYKNVSAKHVTRRSRYMVCALFCMATWLMYGVVWCISEGANILSPSVEGVLYGIADVMGLAYFGLVLWAAQV